VETAQPGVTQGRQEFVWLHIVVKIDSPRPAGDLAAHNGMCIPELYFGIDAFSKISSTVRNDV
jgi:hypothetical protein